MREFFNRVSVATIITVLYLYCLINFYHTFLKVNKKMKNS